MANYALSHEQRWRPGEYALRREATAMSPRLVGSRPASALRCPLLGTWFLLVLFLQSACVTGVPWGSLTAGYLVTRTQ